MKSLYYQRQRVSARWLLGLAVLSLIVVVAVDMAPQPTSASRRELMLRAATAADTSFEIIRQRRVEAGLKMLRIHDPNQTGMLGPSMSQVTSLPGHLDAKQTSVNPNFAAVAVQYLMAAGAKPGDEIAIGCTGSFPALNIAVLTAAEAMNLKPSLVSSAASSQFGANHPALMWPDMESKLCDEGVIRTRSLAISRGGFRDMAVGMTEESRSLLEASILRNGIPMIENRETDSAIESRMKVYAGTSGDVNRFKAYINVGGGEASIGGSRGNELFGHGLIDPATLGRIHDPIDSVATRFLSKGIPVINFTEVVAMAKEHGLPIAPTIRPEIGQGDVYNERPLRKPFAVAGIAIILLLTTMVARPPVWASRRFRWLPAATPASEAQWMV